MKINFVNPAFSLRRGISSAVILICAAILASCGKAPEPAAPREAPAAKPSHEFEIEGRVLLTDSPDSSGIQVFIPGSSALAMTDEKGHFLLAGLSPGTKQIRAQRPGYKPARLGEIEIPALSAPKRYVLPDVSMEPEGSVTGETKRGYGQIGGTIQLGSLESTGGETDLSLARVEVEGTPMRTFADKDGYFFFWNVEPGDYRIAVDMPGYPKVHAPISVAAGKEPTLVSINLSEGAFEQEPREITGQVELTDLEDSPVTDYSGVTVFLRELPDRKITVNPDGTFQIGSLAAQSYTLLAACEGYEGDGEAALDLSDIPTAEVTLSLRAIDPDAKKKGSVSGLAEKKSATTDMSGITVALSGTSYIAITDAKGHYKISNVPEGTYELSAHAEGYDPVKIKGVEVAPGEDTPLETIYLEPILDYPRVVETTPPNGATGILVQYQMPVTIRFSKKMKPEELKNAITISPAVDFTISAGREHAQSDYDFCIIAIDGGSEEHPVKFDAAFRVTVSEEAVDYEGLHLKAPYSFSFRTGRPGVMDTAPANDAKNAVVNPAMPVVVRFNARLDERTIDARDIKIRPSVTGVPTVNAINDPRTGWTSIQIQSVWQPETKYQITIPRRIRTATGQYLENTPYTLKFQTAKAMPMAPAKIGNRTR